MFTEIAQSAAAQAATTVPHLAAAADHWGPGGDGRPGFFFVFPLLWFLLVAGVVITFVATRGRRRQWHARSTGESRLAERFASGEIDEGEYRARLAVLRDSGR